MSNEKKIEINAFEPFEVEAIRFEGYKGEEFIFIKGNFGFGVERITLNRTDAGHMALFLLQFNMNKEEIKGRFSCLKEEHEKQKKN